MPTFADALRQLQSLQNESKTWTSGPLQLVVATSLSDDTPKVLTSLRLLATIKAVQKKVKEMIVPATSYHRSIIRMMTLSERIIFMVYLLECAMLLDLRCKLNIKRA